MAIDISLKIRENQVGKEIIIETIYPNSHSDFFDYSQDNWFVLTIFILRYNY